MFWKNNFPFDKMMIYKAGQILDKISSDVPGNKHVNLFFSDRWLYKLKKRNGLKRDHCFSKSTYLQLGNIVHDLLFFIAKLREYTIDNIRNTDKFSFIDKIYRKSNIGPGKLPEKEEKR